VDQQGARCPCGACKCGEYFFHPFRRDKLDKDGNHIVIRLIAPSSIINIGQDKFDINACLFRQCLGLGLGDL
jgi:hypothetical protein